MDSKKRKQLALSALRQLGGKATTKQIADCLGLHVNGVAQTLGSMENVRGKGKGGDRLWHLVDSQISQGLFE